MLWGSADRPHVGTDPVSVRYPCRYVCPPPSDKGRIISLKPNTCIYKNGRPARVVTTDAGLNDYINDLSFFPGFGEGEGIISPYTLSSPGSSSRSGWGVRHRFCGTRGRMRERRETGCALAVGFDSSPFGEALHDPHFASIFSGGALRDPHSTSIFSAGTLHDPHSTSILSAGTLHDPHSTSIFSGGALRDPHSASILSEGALCDPHSASIFSGGALREHHSYCGFSQRFHR
ncbi:hypothetical protein HMPREF9140_00195 [Prevotella micans F0438]|uniref:Uncharacterized protein n=1 Tax=Prevotella micans F0438 TaxID=883158 RepID=H1PZV7_9BACT|nr:hypothetical protein HMPREF9140_00195 [Prevotella micans F0438]